MNEVEEKFIAELTTAFPAMLDAAKNSPNITATKKTWAYAWDGFTIAELRAALRELIKGDPLTYEQLRSPGQVIRQAAVAIRNRGKTSEADRVNSRLNGQLQKRCFGSESAEVLVKAIAMRQEGKSESEIISYISSSIPQSPAYSQPRYQCHACCDRGIVLVWRADMVDMVSNRKISVDQLSEKHTYVIACNCEHGRSMNERKRVRLPEYSPTKYCRFEMGPIEADRANLIEFTKRKSAAKEWVA